MMSINVLLSDIMKSNKINFSTIEKLQQIYKKDYLEGTGREIKQARSIETDQFIVEQTHGSTSIEGNTISLRGVSEM